MTSFSFDVLSYLEVEGVSLKSSPLSRFRPCSRVSSDGLIAEYRFYSNDPKIISKTPTSTNLYTNVECHVRALSHWSVFFDQSASRKDFRPHSPH